MHEQLTEYHEAARAAALRGAETLEQWRNRFSVREKGRFDLVTEADVASQKAIFSYLHERFPRHDFLGEEGPAAELRPGPDAPPTWIVDPIDGTTNFVHGFPFYCIAVGLQVAGQLVAGAVYDPTRGEMFHAATGLGAWLSTGDEPPRRLQVSQASRLEDALLTTGFPADVRKHGPILRWWTHFSVRTQSLRRTGSTALNLVYIAAGRCDGYWAFDNHVWDVAGATVILREAGGVISNVDGSTFDPYTPDAVAANPLLHAAMLAEFRTGEDLL
jgi:myo-inositol-1(or 4)-monophosphatase